MRNNPAALSRRRLLASLAAISGLLLPQTLRAQGFAGLGSGGAGFALPDPARRLRFPQDHLSHPDFRIEWWYLTANLRDKDGADWGLQWTLFRSALEAGAAERQAWMGHAALTSADLHLSAQRLGRSGQAGVAEAASGPAVWIDEWQMLGDPSQGLSLRASSHDFAYELQGTATGPLVLQGQNGYSVKSQDGSASHYYSQPFLQLSGWVETEAGSREVSGSAWLDREWSSEPLAPDQSGWDWFSLSFANGDKMMAFTVRGAPPYRTAAWIDKDGRIETLPEGSLQAEPLAFAKVAGHDVPIRHRLSLPAKGLEIEVSALRADCWMPMLVPYWEGPVRVSGSHQGIGYLEMTGYDRA